MNKTLRIKSFQNIFKLFTFYILFVGCSQKSNKDVSNSNRCSTKETAYEDTTSQTEFDSLFKMIVESHADHRMKESLADTIAKRVFRFTYGIDASNHSDVDKLDLLHIMLYCNESASRNYRSFLFHKIQSHDSAVLLKPVYAVPFLFCHYCQSTSTLNVLYKKDINMEAAELDLRYQEYYKKIQRIIDSINLNQMSDEKLTQNISIPIYFGGRLLEEKYKIYIKRSP